MPERTDRVAVITGASRGVGRAIAKALVADGYTVAGFARSTELLAEIQSSLTDQPGLFVPFTVDVTCPESIQNAATSISQKYGVAAILVNAAGTFGPIQLIKDSDPQQWINTIMVDAVSAYVTTRAFLPGMLAAGWGRIINVSSAATLHPPGPLNSAYGTAKVALNQFTRHLAAEVEGTGVTANVIHPGDLMTEMWSDIRDQAQALGEIAAAYAEWANWVEETGGDPLEKAANLVDDLITEEPPRNGEFCWIADPLQPPIPSWKPEEGEQPWKQD